MICQIQHVKTQAAPLPAINKELLRAVPSQAHLHVDAHGNKSQRPTWSPITPGPFVVPVTRWVE